MVATDPLIGSLLLTRSLALRAEIESENAIVTAGELPGATAYRRAGAMRLRPAEATIEPAQKVPGWPLQRSSTRAPERDARNI
ncbi:MAG: hypothetical protein WAO61_01075 [Solirubrobacterales bacterium]